MLYDKYQFNTIDEVYGHDSVKKDLKKRFQKKEYPRVTLFSGQSGIGKTNFIHLLSKSILCQNKDNEGNACNNCKYCQAIDKGEPISNYKEYNCAELGIKEVTQIIENSTTKSLSDVSIKIIVLDELQQLKSDEAQKSLLKILEKNNKNVYWIMGTMNIEKIDVSVIRRTTFYKLNEISFDDLVYYLIDICKKENITDVETNEDKAKTIFTIAENSNGSIGVALGYLDRVINSEIWSEDDLRKELDLYSQSSINNILNNLFEGDVNIFSNKITKNIIPSFFKKLILLYKYQIGSDLNKYEREEIKGLNVRVHVDIISFIIEEMNKLNNQYYLTNDMIQYSLLNIIRFIKSNEKNEKPAEIQREPRKPRS